MSKNNNDIFVIKPVSSFDNSQNPYVFTLKKREKLLKKSLILTMNLNMQQF